MTLNEIVPCLQSALFQMRMCPFSPLFAILCKVQFACELFCLLAGPEPAFHVFNPLIRHFHQGKSQKTENVRDQSAKCTFLTPLVRHVFVFPDTFPALLGTNENSNFSILHIFYWCDFIKLMPFVCLQSLKIIDVANKKLIICQVNHSSKQHS